MVHDYLTIMSVHQFYSGRYAILAITDCCLRLWSRKLWEKLRPLVTLNMQGADCRNGPNKSLCCENFPCERRRPHQTLNPKSFTLSSKSHI